jgi:hypothetical protein
LAAMAKRFRVALSFAGEKRDFVARVAASLAKQWSRDQILYDQYHESEFAVARLGFHLPALYNEHADLVVAVLCKDYDVKEWCGLEWDAIYGLIKRRRERQVMLCRFDYVEPEGLYGLAGFVDLDGRDSDHLVGLILERLALNEGVARDFYARRAHAVSKERARPRAIGTKRFDAEGTAHERSDSSREMNTLRERSGLLQATQDGVDQLFRRFSSTQLVQVRPSSAVDSPFHAGEPIRKRENFCGRSEALSRILVALDRGRPAQLLGEPRMGKTSLLYQLFAVLPQQPPVVLLDAQGLDGSSPKALVCAIAEALQRRIGGLRFAEPLDAAAALRELSPVCVLIDEAQVLARPGHGFDEGFLGECRSLCQKGKLRWLSASHDDLEERFRSTGLISRFLNDSQRFSIGALDPEGVEQLLAPLATAERWLAREATGDVPYGLQLVGDMAFRGKLGEAGIDRLGTELDRVHESWWQRRSDEERQLLAQLLVPRPVTALAPRGRTRSRWLADRGLVREDEGKFSVPGAFWRRYVADQTNG